MFGKLGIGYALCVDAEVRNAADQSAAAEELAMVKEPAAAEELAETGELGHQPTTPAEQREGWRSWFGKGVSHVSADQNADAELAGDEAADDDVSDEGGVAGGRPAIRLPWRQVPGRQVAGRQAPSPNQVSLPMTSRPLINPHLRADPRLRIWIIRTVICLILFLAISMWLDWRLAVTAAVIYACADIIYRSRTTVITPTSVRVTSAQRKTGKRLQVLRSAGYMSLYARKIPGTESVIDHVVVGPSGVFTVDSQLMDTRLPVRAKGGVLYHGPVSQDDKLEHARFEAEHAAALIATELGQRVRVRPTMVIYGPSLPWAIMRLKGVDVFDGRHITTYFRKQSKAAAAHQLDTARVALVFAAASHALPPLH